MFQGLLQQVLHRTAEVRPHRRLRIESVPQRLEVLRQLVGRVHRIGRLPVDAERDLQVVEHALPQLAPLVLQQGLGCRPVLVRQVAGVAPEPLSGQDVLQHDQIPQVPCALGLKNDGIQQIVLEPLGCAWRNFSSSSKSCCGV